MKNQKTCTWLTILLMAVSLAGYSPPAEAQFLKNLSKGLEKVNKAIKKVENATKGTKNSDRKTDSEKSKDTKAPESGVQSSRQANNPASSATPADAKTVAKKNKKPVLLTPYLTWDTKVLNFDIYFDNLPDISDGIFYLSETNPNLGGYTRYYSFWTVDGKRLFPPQYEQMSGSQGHPRFDSGACVMREAKKKDAPIILYTDGTTLPLSKDWKSVSPIMDGVAMVEEKAPNGDLCYFYINTKGKKIWPNLNDTYTIAEQIKTRKLGGVYIRPLKEGRRAFFDRTAKKWGFLDARGKIVIKPVYTEVRDFCGGYALTVSPTADQNKHKQAFIGMDGTEYASIPENYSSLAPIHVVTNVGNGIFAHRHFDALNTHLTVYHDVATGKELKRFAGGGTGFYDGYAFVRLEPYANEIYVINTAFNPIRMFGDPDHHINLEEVEFKDFPWYTVDHRYAINNEGYTEMYVPRSFERDGRLGQFSGDGFAKARTVFDDPSDPDKKLEYTGYVDASGRMRVVFSKNPRVKGPFEELPGPPKDSLPPIKPGPPWPGYPIPPIRPIPPVPPVLQSGDTIPVGPVGPGREALKYKVSVIASPPEGGTVYGSGEYSLGDTLRVTGKSAPGYKISEISCDRPGSYTSTFNKFVVDGDMEITCYFVKEDTIRPIDKGIFAGPLTWLEYPLKTYMELGKVDGNEYTGTSSGVMAVLTNDNKGEINVTGSDNHAAWNSNVFFAPMNVLGIMEENGKKYIRFDGGVIKYTLDVKDTTGWGFINNPFLMFAMAFDGAGQGELDPGCYRVEIVEGSPEEGEFTLGMLQRKSGKYGWIPSDDPSFVKKLPGFFTRRYDKGLPADYLAGATLKAGDAAKIQWEPSDQFFGEPSLLQSFIGALGSMYRKKVKSTVLEDYDIWQFSNDIDKHIFKPM